MNRGTITAVCTVYLAFAMAATADAAMWDLRKLAVDVRASSDEPKKNLGAANACDGVDGTRWSSDFSDPQWIQIRFQKSVPIQTVEIWWEAAFAAEYSIDVSDDGKKWKTVHEVTNGKGGYERLTLTGARGSFARIFGRKRGTQWGYSIHEWLLRGEMPEPEPDYGGLIRKPPPPPTITIYDHNKEKLDSHFKDLIAADPPTSAQMSDEEFLDLIQRRAFDYYWYEVHPGSLFPVDSLIWKTATSTAAAGFALAAYVVGHERGYRPREEIYQRVEALVNNIWDDPNDPDDLHIEHMSGHPYHWTNIATGRWEDAEGIITHDSMKLFCGMILIKHYFKGTKAGDIAAKYINAIDWKWLEHGVKDRPYLGNFFTRHSDPSGPGDVIMYDGMKLDYLIPMGAAKGVAPYYWDNWAQSYPWDDYRGHFWRIERPAIWIHQWDNTWVDFRYMMDAYADYHQNSVEATLANRQWCIDNNVYSENCWGINPSSGPGAGPGEIYGNYGAPPDELPFQNGKGNDGTITPCAAIPSIIFTPGESIDVARHLYDKYKDRVWGRYGFVDALNPQRDWFSKNVIGIDQGPIIANIENYRTGLIWNYFMREEMLWRGLDNAGFVGIVDNFDPSEHSPPYAEWSADSRVMRFRTLNEDVREGNRSLKVIYRMDSGDSSTLTARPLRNDFSHWSYLAFWKRGGPDLRLSVVSESGVDISLKRVADFPADAGWRRWTYELPAMIRSNPVRELRFVLSKKDGPRGDFYLDEIVLTNRRDIPPTPSVLDDFEDPAGNPRGRWVNWLCDPGIQARRATDRVRNGRYSLKLDINKSGEAHRWAHVGFKPQRIRDLRKFHSISLWVYGQAEFMLKFTDAGGKSVDMSKARADKAGEWNHVFLNIQRNSPPEKTIWDTWQAGKKDIAEILLFIDPGETNLKKTVYIDDVGLTE